MYNNNHKLIAHLDMVMVMVMFNAMNYQKYVRDGTCCSSLELCVYFGIKKKGKRLGSEKIY